MTSQANRRKQIQVLLTILIFLLSFISLYIMGAFKSPATKHKVVFYVNASGGYALITLKTPEDSILEPTIVTTPWRMEITLPTGSEVYLTAANPTQTGELTCTISLENSVWKSMKKEAPKNGIACAGIIP